MAEELFSYCRELACGAKPPLNRQGDYESRRRLMNIRLAPRFRRFDKLISGLPPMRPSADKVGHLFVNHVERLAQSFCLLAQPAAPRANGPAEMLFEIHALTPSSENALLRSYQRRAAHERSVDTIEVHGRFRKEARPDVSQNPSCLLEQTFGREP